MRPLLQDLPASSFTSEIVSLHNPWNLNSKGINTATFYSYLGDGTFVTSQGTAATEISVWKNVTIIVTLPKLSLIKGVWWSTYYRDTNNGIVNKIGQPVGLARGCVAQCCECFLSLKLVAP